MFLSHVETTLDSTMSHMEAMAENGGPMSGWMILVWVLWLVLSLLLITALTLSIIALNKYISGTKKNQK